MVLILYGCRFKMWTNIMADVEKQRERIRPLIAQYQKGELTQFQLRHKLEILGYTHEQINKILLN